jgi:hypothetical protein
MGRLEDWENERLEDWMIERMEDWENENMGVWSWARLSIAEQTPLRNSAASAPLRLEKFTM